MLQQHRLRKIYNSLLIVVVTLTTCSTQSSSSGANTLAGLLGIVLGDLTGLLGLDCSPLSIIGVGTGNGCTASPVCCSNTEAVSDSLLEITEESTHNFGQGGLIGIGCIPITL